MTICIYTLSVSVCLDNMVLGAMDNVRMIFRYFVFWVVTWKMALGEANHAPSTSDALYNILHLNQSHRHP
jgi:hypothetical protein